MTALEGTTRYHWVLTLTGQINGRQATIGDHGLCDMRGSQSRYDVCTDLVQALLDDVMRRTGQPLTSHNIAYFDLQPDRLGK